LKDLIGIGFEKNSDYGYAKMLAVTSLNDAIQLAMQSFGELRTERETVGLAGALNRVLLEAVSSDEFVPLFNRSTVDGYAVISSDVFGSSDSIPAILNLLGESQMGKHTDLDLKPGQCAAVPTGGEVPAGADAMVMVEYTENLGGGQVAIYKPVAPGTNIIMRGEDTKPGDVVLPAGRRINAADTGSLAALGVTSIPVSARPRVAILSTGDELITPEQKPTPGQIRDVNTPLLYNAVLEAGGEPFELGILRDDEDNITRAVQKAAADYDLVIISGGTSVGEKDAMPRVIAKLGRMLLHGIAVKPGKPTLFGEINGVPVFGLAGNPVAAYFLFYILIRPILFNLQGAEIHDHQVNLPIARAYSSNHGREEIVPVKVRAGLVHPIASKSGLITTLAGTDGFIRIPRDTEGLREGDLVQVTLFSR
jgi:molybdopterin molybdotransferase